MWLTAKAVEHNSYIPHCPTLKQLRFLAAPHREKLFGGAAGGGKSDALLMDALLYVEEPGYSAILFRKTYADLALPGALMDRAHEWLGPTDAHWNEQTKTWTFPSGATLSFGYLEHEKDKFRYQGSEFQYIGFDELTQFKESQYRYLRSRLRRGSTMRVPLRIGSASNPGGVGHDWVFKAFVERPDQRDVVFIPALLDDNPHLDREEYRKALEALDEVTRMQLLEGQWVKDECDVIFRREWFAGRYDAVDLRLPVASVARYIFWDTAFKEGEERDYSACVVAELSSDYTLYVREVGAWRLEFPDLLSYMEDIAARHNQDRKLRGIVVEDVGAGTSAIQTLRGASRWVAPYIQAFRVRGKKTERAREASVWARRGMVKLPAPSPEVSWLHDFEEQLFAFPITEHDDMTDAFVMSILYLRHYLAEGWRARAGTQVA